MSGAFDPVRLLHALTEQDVRFVVIGDMASRTWGSPQEMQDLDICYHPDDAPQLLEALHALHAKRRDDDSAIDEATLAEGGNFLFATDAGHLDCITTPAGTDGYDDLAKHAVQFDLDGIRVAFACLADLIRMKQALDRPKDRRDVDILRRLAK